MVFIVCIVIIICNIEFCIRAYQIYSNISRDSRYNYVNNTSNNTFVLYLRNKGEAVFLEHPYGYVTKK